MSLESLIGGLSHAEKLDAMDMLWESLSSDSTKYVSPGWHERVIADRLANPQQGESLSLTEAKAEIKEQLNARRASG